jgi:hypothetical protein
VTGNPALHTRRLTGDFMNGSNHETPLYRCVHGIHNSEGRPRFP